MHRRLYDWVIGWAQTRHGAAALFLLAAAESSFFPIPPDVLLIALVLGAPRRWARLALICTVGSVVGGVIGYGIGAGLMDTLGAAIIRTYKAEEYYNKICGLYAEYDCWLLLAAAFTPIPYKVFTIASGALSMNLLSFALVSLAGRGARFLLVAALLWKFGPPLRTFIERYFNLLTLALLAAIVAGFAVVTWMS
ncbi:MAG: DedA family protein [Phycisphaerales bacterium]|nr:MAG: DedA family protein [Phycisphaerales bacterium]